MFKTIWRQLATGIKPVPGTWRQVDAATAHDSVLGTCRLDPHDAGRFSATMAPFGEVRVSIRPGDDEAAAYTYARSVLVNLPRMDAKYRRFAAADVYEFYEALSPDHKLSQRELADALKLSWIQLLDPCSNGGTIWYSAGGQLGGANVGVRLDANRRYAGAGCG